MIGAIKTILFTSNLSKTSRAAFSHAALLALQLNAKIVLLHVIEKLPETYEKRILGVFGEDRWKEMLSIHKEEAQHALIGKITSRQMVRTALSEFCREAGIEKNHSGFGGHEILIKEGDIVETILQEAADHACDLIVMGASKGLSAESAIGDTIESVLKRSRIPTLVVPVG